MDQPLILIVDDEEDVCEILKDRLDSSGYQTICAFSGQEALERVQQKKPDLILLDVMMPEMDGYEGSRRLMSSTDTAAIPIMMLTAKASPADKVKALTMGIDDYITKPYDSEELMARMKLVLRRSKKGTAPALIKEQGPQRVQRSRPITQEDQKRIQLLGEMIKTEVMVLKPVYNTLSTIGYSYPFAAKILEVPEGTEIFHLDLLAERGCFQKEFFDKILLCPHCKNCNLNIRETCTQCKSPHLKVIEMLHHYRCAYIGTEDEFKKGIDYLCPKCHKELKHIGVDYEKPGENYLCEPCHAYFPEAQTVAQCRACAQIFDVDQAHRQVIWTYLVTEKAREIVNEGSFTEEDYEGLLIDPEVGIYNLRYLRSEFSQEVKRCQVFGRPVSLLMFEFDQYDEILKTQGEATAQRLLKTLTIAIKENLRAVDIPARYNLNTLVVLLLEVDREKSLQILERIRPKILSALPTGIHLKIRVISYPEDGENEEGLLTQLLKSTPV